MGSSRPTQSDACDIKDGTNCLQPSPRPGSLGATGGGPSEFEVNASVGTARGSPVTGLAKNNPFILVAEAIVVVDDVAGEAEHARWAVNLFPAGRNFIAQTEKLIMKKAGRFTQLKSARFVKTYIKRVANSKYGRRVMKAMPVVPNLARAALKIHETWRADYSWDTKAANISSLATAAAVGTLEDLLGFEISFDAIHFGCLTLRGYCEIANQVPMGKALHARDWADRIASVDEFAQSVLNDSKDPNKIYRVTQNPGQALGVELTAVKTIYSLAGANWGEEDYGRYKQRVGRAWGGRGE